MGGWKDDWMKAKPCVLCLVFIIASASVGTGYTCFYGGMSATRFSPVKVRFVDVDISSSGSEESVDVDAYIVGGSRIRVSATNVYPGYEFFINFTVTNDGGRRIHIDEVDIDVSDENMLEVVVSNMVCTWLCPGENKEGYLVVQVSPEVEPNHSYTFDVDIRFSRGLVLRPRPPWWWKQQFQVALGVRRGVLVVPVDVLERHLDQVSDESAVYDFKGSQTRKFEQAVEILGGYGNPYVKTRLMGELLSLWLNLVAGWTKCLEVKGLTACEVIEGSENVLQQGAVYEYRYWRRLCHKFNYHSGA